MKFTFFTQLSLWVGLTIVSSSFAIGQTLKTGDKVLRQDYIKGATLQTVTGLVENRVRTDWAYGTDYEDPSRFQPFQRQSRIVLADGTAVRRGDKVLRAAPQPLGFTLQKVTDIANGMIQTDWATGTYYQVPAYFEAYKPQAEIALKDGSRVKRGDVVFRNGYQLTQQQVVDIANDKIESDWNYGGYYQDPIYFRVSGKSN